MLNFKFLDPFFQYIEGDKLYRQPFKILYYAIGVLGCFGALYYLSKIFDFVSLLKGVAYLYAILMVVVFLAAAVFTLFFWARRASEVNTDENYKSRFISLPVVGRFIRSFSEWFGIVLAGVGSSAGILAALILPLAVERGGGEIFKDGLIFAIVAAVVGFLTLVFGRASGEKLIAIGAIADESNKK